MKKILYISGTRSDYGLMKRTLFFIRKNPKLKLEIAATGMHLMPEFGSTIKEIKKDGFKIHKIYAIYKSDNKKSMADFTGKFILGLTKDMKRIKPDIILILGDRPEILAAAITGTYLTIPIVHVHGGDISSGVVDEPVRHAVTKLAHIHLAATSKAAERIIKMGEDRRRVYVVGAPGLDSILNERLLSRDEIAAKYSLDLLTPLILVIQHPVIMASKNPFRQMRETMEAVRELGYQAIVIYPNADTGGREMINVIEKYRGYPSIHIYKSIPHIDYLSLMKTASVMVGNSSSGIIETPSFHLPVVNIGTRQDGRERAENIVDVGYSKKLIKAAINKCLFDRGFKNKVKYCKSPYGKGHASEKITKILTQIKLNKDLLQKKITY